MRSYERWLADYFARLLREVKEEVGEDGKLSK